MVRLSRARSRIASAPSRLPTLKKVAGSIYRDPRWIALRAKRKGDPDWRAAKARAKPGERLILDHVIEVRDGGAPFDPVNTEWLTFSEHQVKTERSKRRRAGLE